MVYNIRWGILATGGIAKTFVRDLLKDARARGTDDVTHSVVAVASSSSAARAREFIETLHIPNEPAAYGTYEELVADANVDIVYIATPHSHHYQNVRLALEVGRKHVLCEKPFTVNATQTRTLVDIAQRQRCFLMEAVWTRYFPLSVQVRARIQAGEIGEVLRVLADNSTGEPEWEPSHRMVNLDLAGGALLDLGVYSLTWVFQTLYHTLPPAQRQPPSRIASTMFKYPSTGADEDTTMLLTFPTTTPSNSLHAQRTSHAVAMTALALDSNLDKQRGPSIRIQGTQGEIQIEGPAHRPEGYRVLYADASKPVEEVRCPFPDNGHGMYWEADEAARCVRDGRLQSDGMPWEESVVIMEVMDEVRRQNGLAYPDKIETTEYPVAI